MKKLGLLVVMVSLLGLASCDMFGPSQADVETVWTAVTAGLTSATTSDGSPVISGDTITMKMKNADSTATTTLTVKTTDGSALLAGSKMEFKFAKYKHTTSGYTIDGTMTAAISGTMTNMTMVFTGSLTPSGGVINALALDFTATMTGSGTSAKYTYSGKIKANGKEFDVTKFPAK